MSASPCRAENTNFYKLKFAVWSGGAGGSDNFAAGLFDYAIARGIFFPRQLHAVLRDKGIQ